MNLQSRKIIYFGMPGVFSTIPFRALLASEANIEAVVFPRPGKDKRGLFMLPTFEFDIPKIELPLVKMPITDNLQVEASRFGIPIYSIGNLDNPATVQGLKNFDADVFVIACFPYIFPPEMIAVPKEGCINLHPSLLPAYRGPEPLFWQYYHEETQKGVSIHLMDAGIDSGPIIAQKEVDYPDTISSYAELETHAADASAGLLLDALSQETIPQQPQSQEGTSYYPLPQSEDMRVLKRWDAEQIERMNTLFPHFGQFT